MSIAYASIFMLSLILIPAYAFCIHKKTPQPWLCGLFICMSVANLGWLALSLAPNVTFALFANKIAYLGQIFLLLCMFMLIATLSGFHIGRRSTYLLVGASVLMFALICTTGHLDWYYRSAELICQNGQSVLVKEYGILHPTYLIYVITYFLAMLTVIILCFIRNRGSSPKLAVMMLCVVLGNIGMWIIEKFIPLHFEFLSISYLTSEVVFFSVYLLLQDYVHINHIPKVSVAEKETSVIYVDTKDRAEKIQKILDRLPQGVTISPRQMDILEGILQGKARKEIAADLHLSENTVKMHISSLYKTLGVSRREEIYAMIQE